MTGQNDFGAEHLREPLQGLFEERFGHQLSERKIGQLEAAACDIARRGGFGTVEQYLGHLRTLPIDAPLLQALLQIGTNNESYFFRDSTSMASLRDQVLPEIIERTASRRHLRIWSAGCSGGEELYSVAILLRELVPDIDFWELSLVGTDVDAAALERARRAEYKTWSLRATDVQQRARHFEASPDGSRFRLRERYRRGVSFHLHNLADASSQPPTPGAFDLVLCRNVSIYLHARAREALRKKIATALVPQGRWIAGPSDPVPEGGFDTVVRPGLLDHSLANVPRKKRRSSSSPVEPPTPFAVLRPEPPRGTAPVAPIPAPSLPRALFALPPIEAGVGVGDSEVWRRRSPVPASSDSAPSIAAPSDPGPRLSPREANPLDEARRLADGGRLEEALAAVNAALASDPMDVEGYLLQAMLRESLGNVSGALESLRRVIYLAPAHGEAYLRLGLLLQRTGEVDAAVKALRNALVVGDADSDFRKVAGRQLMRALKKQGS